MKKIVVTGATGLLGRALVKVLSQSNTVIGTGFRRAAPPIEQLDLHDQTAITAFLDTHQPEVLVHAAAERKPDICENDHQATMALNVQAAEFLASQCKKRHIQFVLVSTDYVFDGQSAPYTENDATSPVNFYGQSKAHAELAVLAACPEHTVVRVPVLYGDVKYLAESAVTIIAEQVIKDRNSAHDDWAIRYPTHVEDIALTLNDLLAQPRDKQCGTFHISNNQLMTKYAMAVEIAKALALDTQGLVALPEPSQTATRPYNCALQDTRLHTMGIKHHRDFATAIAKVLSQHSH
ncbi:dTDP-4-dehydrorhamnose reductase family protein [Pseudoalteromonas obscura]|uniref:dTDP-4-dehydrorhamnose reductase n=1 Tax=Pseudoalteromonas obscura TaxID=3048491 RepID=A0ABT7ERM8_9GAMM|nr:SDR family oxidoreductase [Pseudoalteromonas sp. P94(2023)]MDK2597677.1 SDR family oxidoreductase [Pseudoalteromonas sp. P94(2023)]